MGALSKFAVAIAALCVPLATADTPASQPSFSSVSYSGNGCPNDPKEAGSFTDPTFTYNRFAAVLPGENQTVNCQVHATSSGGSAGWQYALTSVTINGHLVLDPGTELDFYTTVFYSESAANTVTAKRTFTNNGGDTLDYPVTFRQTIKPVFSQCIGSNPGPGILNVNSRSALLGNGHAYFEVDSQNWDFTWRRC